jgi:hypothetical protein
MSFLEGCFLCGEELVYTQEATDKKCHYCGQVISSNVSCPSDHFVCDTCHSSSAADLIINTCIKSKVVDPVKIANDLMRSPQIKMHGPEHHFLVPAVLLTAYYNAVGDFANKDSAIRIARRRADAVLGGFCGTHGNCGAAVGTGIFISIITGNTPLAEEEWKLSNTMTAATLLSIANQGGPRCCKRDSFIAIHQAIDFLKEHFGVILPKNEINCTFSSQNKQCKFDDCQYFDNQ